MTNTSNQFFTKIAEQHKDISQFQYLQLAPLFFWAFTIILIVFLISYFKKK